MVWFSQWQSFKAACYSGCVELLINLLRALTVKEMPIAGTRMGNHLMHKRQILIFILVRDPYKHLEVLEKNGMPY